MKRELKNVLLDEFNEFDHIIADKIPLRLTEIHRSAILSFLNIGFPTRKHEEFKYTNLNFLNEFDFRIAKPDDPINLVREDVERLYFEELSDNVLVFVNGRFKREFSNIKTNGNGVQVTSFSEEMAKGNPLVLRHFSKYAKYVNDPFVALNTAFADDGFFIHFPVGTIIEKPIHMLFITDATEKSLMIQPRNLIVADRGSQVKIMETCHTFGEHAGLTNHVTEIFADQDSVVDFYKVNSCTGNAYNFSTTQVSQQSNSKFNSTSIYLKGKFVRNSLNTVLNGEHSEANLNGFYFADGKNFVDNHTVVDHAKPNCQSNEVYKGILDNESTAVFSGKINVQKNAQGTNAFQTNRNILLTDDATIFTKPCLEILADDVKCSHGATAGQLDKDSLFYLRARGISKENARALLLNAFASEIIEKIAVSELRNEIKKQIAERLQAEEIYFCDINI